MIQMMQTRLKKCQDHYNAVKQERIDLFNTYRKLGTEAPFMQRCEILGRLYEAKIKYTKQYHGIKFDELLRDTQRLCFLQYKAHVLYKENPTQENKENIEKIGMEHREAKKRLFGNDVEL